MLTSKDPRLAGRVAFTHPNFVSYTLARFFIVVALEMQSVAVGWQVYEITKRPHRSWIRRPGPVCARLRAVSLRRTRRRLFDRRKLLMWCYGGFGLCSALLLAISWRAPQSVHSIYVVLVLLGIFRCFNLAGQPRSAAATGSRRTFRERSRLERQHLSDRNHRRPGHRRNRLCPFPRPGERSMPLPFAVSILSTIFTLRIHPLPASPEKDFAKSGRERARQPAHGARRFSFYLGEEADPGFHLARHVRRPARRSCRLAPDLCREPSCILVPGDSACCAVLPA